MTTPGTPTLDQLQIFLAIVDTGSFAGAGRKLNRAVSVISYGIGNLEAQLGVMLFDREGTRKPQLTEAGRAVLAEIRSINNEVDVLRAKVKGLLEGLEPELDLVVDVMMPSARLGRVLREFAAEFPSVQLCLHVEALGAVTSMVLNRTASIGISGPLYVGKPGIDSRAVGVVALVPVAAPCHPLGMMDAITSGAGRNYMQIVLTDRSEATAGVNYAVVSDKTWRLSDLGTKYALLLEGVGWGNMPLPMVEDDLKNGRLVRLNMPDDPGGTYRFAGIWRTDNPPGPAAAWLLDRFAELGQDDRGLPGAGDL